MTLQLHVVAHSEVGLVRKNNQDSGYASLNLLVVADGMGGAAAGDLASAVAIDTIRKVDVPTTGNEMLEVLAGALHRANDRIADLVEADHTLEGMGTTVTGVLFDGSCFGLAHIGDSRAYLLRDDRMERLTHDHTWVQSLVDEGRIDESEAAIHPHRSLLLKVLNGQPGTDPDLTLVRVTAGDRLLLCSDGLCGLVDDATIKAALGVSELDAARQALVDEALAEGGVDNITVILAEVVEADRPVDGALVHDSVTLGAATERKIPSVETRGRHPGAGSAGELGADVSEDTLISTDPVTVTGEPPRQTPGEDESRYNPQPPRKRRFGRVFVGALALLLIAAAGLGSAYAWTRTQFYVGASSEKVAIFRGLPEGLPGFSLSRLYEVQPLAVSALPSYYQEKVRATIDVANLSAARQTVLELTEAAKRCASQPSPTLKPTATPSPTVPSASSKPPSPKPTTSGKPTASWKPTLLPSTSGTASIETSC